VKFLYVLSSAKSKAGLSPIETSMEEFICKEDVSIIISMLDICIFSDKFPFFTVWLILICDSPSEITTIELEPSLKLRFTALLFQSLKDLYLSK